MKLSEHLKERLEVLEAYHDFDISDREAGRLEDCLIMAKELEHKLEQAELKIEDLKRKLLIREIGGIE